MARILSLPFHCDQKVWCMPPSTGDWYDWYQSPTFRTVFFDSIMQFYFALIHFWIHFFFELKFDIEGFVFVWISHVCCICRRFIYPSMVFGLFSRVHPNTHSNTIVVRNGFAWAVRIATHSTTVLRMGIRIAPSKLWFIPIVNPFHGGTKLRCGWM